MDGPNILRVADRYGDLAINPWSECQFLLATWRPLVPEAMPTVPAPVVPLDELLWSQDCPQLNEELSAKGKKETR